MNSNNGKSYLIVAYALLLITLAVNISMPLFRVYAATSHFNNVETSLVFSTYILGMLPCYIFLGGLSDRWGRRPVVLISVLSGFIATAIVTFRPDVYALIFARFFQGVGLGLGMGAATAYLSELLQADGRAPTKAAGLASLFTAVGFGGGAFATTLNLLVHFTMRPVTYYFLLAFTLIGLLLLYKVPKLTPIGGGLIRLPYFPHGSLPINIAIGICWAATGVVIAIVPTQLAKFNLTPYAGFCLVLISWTGAFSQSLIRKVDPLKAVRIGLYLIPLGFALVIAGCQFAWLPVILLGTCIIGLAAYGYSYLGGLALITNLGGQKKARAVSGYMFFGYIGFGIPAVLLGYFADRFGIVNALMLFEAFIIALSGWLYYIFSKPSHSIATITVTDN